MTTGAAFTLLALIQLWRLAVEGMQILAINGVAYDADVLKDAVRAAQANGAPIELIVQNGDRFLIVNIDYRGGLRYPRLERDASVPARLDEILTPR